MQVVLTTYSSVEALLVGFDTDASCACYDLSKGAFVVSPRGRRALEYRVNVMQSSRHSAAFARRLERYASRGFSIGPRWRLSLLIVCRGVCALRCHVLRVKKVYRVSIHPYLIRTSSRHSTSG